MDRREAERRLREAYLKQVQFTCAQSVGNTGTFPGEMNNQKERRSRERSLQQTQLNAVK